MTARLCRRVSRDEKPCETSAASGDQMDRDGPAGATGSGPSNMQQDPQLGDDESRWTGWIGEIRFNHSSARPRMVLLAEVDAGGLLDPCWDEKAAALPVQAA